MTQMWEHWRMATAEEVANQNRLHEEMIESWKRGR